MSVFVVLGNMVLNDLLLLVISEREWRRCGQCFLQCAYGLVHGMLQHFLHAHDSALVLGKWVDWWAIKPAAAVVTIHGNHLEIMDKY